MDRYPTWRYHATKAAMVVDSPEREAELTPDADGWAYSPADAAALQAALDAKAAEIEAALAKAAARPQGKPNGAFDRGGA